MDIDALVGLSRAAGASIDNLSKRDDAVGRLMSDLTADAMTRSMRDILMSGTPALRRAVTKIRFTAENAAPQTDFPAMVLEELRKQKVPNDVLEEARGLLAGQRTKRGEAFVHPEVRELPGTPADTINRAAPSARVPAMERLVEFGNGARIGRSLGLEDDVIARLCAAGVAIGRPVPGGLGTLTENKVLNKAELERFEKVNAVARILDGEPEVAERLGKEIPDLGAPEALLDIAPEQWGELAKERKGTAAIDPADWGRLVSARMESAFPALALKKKIKPSKGTLTEDTRTLLDAAKVLDRPLFSGAPLTTKERDILGDKAEAVAAAQRRIKQADGKLPGFGIATLLETGNGTIAQRVSAAGKLAGQAESFLEKNPDFLSFDLTSASDDVRKLEFGTAKEEDKAQILAFAQSYQRLFAVARTPDLTAKLSATGHRSALSVAAAKPDQLVASGALSMTEATAVIDRAAQIAPGVVGLFGGVLDGYRDWFDRLPFGASPPGFQKVLKEIPGFGDFFGDQDYCGCEHCRSILSPAAYFVDLMRFVEDGITNVAFAGRADHPLNLSVRRPDLWTFPLTCENTNDFIPILQIVCEVVETFIATREGFGGDMSDQALIARFVYRDRLPHQVDSFYQPFVLPIRELAVFLSHDRLSLRDIAEVIRADRDTYARLGMALSEQEFAQIITPETGLARLRTLYGVQFAQAGGAISPFEPKALFANTGLDRLTLGRAIATRYVTRNGTDDITIAGRKRSAESVQNDMEEMRGLTRIALDRLRRLTLTVRALGWSFDAVDVAHRTLLAAGRSDQELTPRTLSSLVALKALMESHKLSLEDALAICALIPQHPVVEDGKTLMDRLFNGTPYAQQTPWPDAATTILLPAFAPSGTPVQPEAARLQAGLGIDDEAMANLVRALAPTMGIDPEAENAGAPDLAARSFPASLDNLSLLYRHARLATVLKIDMRALGRLLALAPGVSAGGVAGFEEIRALTEFVAYLDSADRTVDDLDFITGGTPLDPAVYPDKVSLAQALVEGVVAENALQFGAGIFTTLDGISTVTSAAIIAANPGLMVASGDGFALAPGYDPAAVLALPADNPAGGIEVPAAIRADIAPLHALLGPFYAPSVIAARAALALQTRPEVFAAALAMLGADMTSQPVLDALTGVGPIAPFEDMFAATAPLCLAMQSDALEQAQLDFLVARRVPVFGINNPKALNVTSVMRIDRYAERADDADTAAAAAALDACLAGFDPVAGFAAANIADLAIVLDCDPALAASLHDVIALSPDPFRALDELAAGVSLARRLAIGGTAFAQMASDDYDTLAAGSEALQAGLRSRYETLETWEEKIEDYRDQVLSSRRDGLVAYMIASVGGQFENAEDIYRYFLIDAQMEGCGRTSRVVSANSTLQLYVQRVMLNLEETPEGHPDPVHVQPGLVDEGEWAWRKNYRVWEANRRVFLYPENYLLPELRDNKSELFETFEETLAAQDINADTVRDAYSAYLRGFEELSRLQVSGAFLENDSTGKHDVLHLFGVTANDPVRHFYRRIEDFTYGVTEADRATEWSTWREIDLKIQARKVSPIIHQGRLHIFWTEVSTTPRQKIVGGTSEFDGYNHKFRLMNSMRRLDGTWAEPQQLKLENPPFFFGDGVVVDEATYSAVHYQDNVPHSDVIDGYTLKGFPWDRVYPEHLTKSRSSIIIRGLDYRVNAPVDFHKMRLGETLTSGVENVQVPWIDPLSGLFALLFGSPIGFPSSNLLWSEVSGDERVLFKGTRPSFPYFPPYATGSLLIKREDFKQISRNRAGYNYMLIGNGDKTGKIIDAWSSTLTSEIEKSFTGPRVIEFDEGEPDLQVINGAPNHAIIDVEGALFSLLDQMGAGGKYRLARLNSSLAEDIAETLFNRGVDAMLDIATQNALAEHGLPFTIKTAQVDATPAKVGKVDYGGAMGVYLQEIYFHLPVLIARTLNAQGDYAEAREWFHKVFDPTSSEEITDIPAGLGPEDVRRRKLDRVWKYRRFRNREVTSLRDILEDEAALETYRRDPFNPHAIARSRASAYQKYVVLAYVDNLLDEADALFATDMREQIDEAVLLYVTALDILGPRPQKLGDCGEKIGAGLTYEDLEPHIAGDDDMLLEIESYVINRNRQILPLTAEARAEATLVPAYATLGEVKLADSTTARLKGQKFETTREIEALLKNPALAEKLDFMHGVRDADYALAAAQSAGRAVSVRGPYDAEMSVSATRSRNRVASQGVGSVGRVSSGAQAGIAVAERVNETARLVGRFGVRRPSGSTGASNPWDVYVPDFGLSIIRSVNPIFCVPENDALKGYWDRVEDRLFKIRNCMNIDGVKRPLALFAPRIDPMMLVRARAAGLEISDLLGAGAGELPPFRFRFLLERARSATASAKALGDAMARALGSKDAEELAQLRNAHQANILALSKELKSLDIANAESAIEELAARRLMVEARRDHYNDLISEGDLPAETVQKVAKITAASLKAIGGGLTAASGFAGLIPDVGAPTTIEWGGTQISTALRGSADTIRTLGEVADIVSMIAGMSGSHERRYQGWAHQRAMAEHELDTFTPREEAAANRLEIARRNLALHEAQIANQDEIIDFYADKFTGLGLYSHLASTLQRLHRQAFNIALSYARLAETAYRFETSEDSFTIQSTYWDASRAGLLAGDKLLLDLSTLEQRFIEGRRRKMEINQTFSLSQLDPAALMELRATGGANFDIPEWAFDLFYPGQFNRRTKAVRLTIPCVAGPYTNISAQLSQTSSAIRPEPDLTLPLSAAPRARDTMIASSTAQADSGVFELNFRDDRYLPFEGSGAVSSWRIDLPSTFRPFNYASITDVLVNISYTADYDAGLRADVEDVAATLDQSLAAIFDDTGLRRVFSLRQDASAAYQRLVASPAGTAVDFDLTEVHFPIFARGRALSVGAVTVLVETGRGVDGSDAEFTLNARPVAGFAADATYGGLLAKGVANAFPAGVLNTHRIVVTDAGGLTSADGVAAMSHDAIKDIHIVIDYTIGGLV